MATPKFHLPFNLIFFFLNIVNMSPFTIPKFKCINACVFTILGYYYYYLNLEIMTQITYFSIPPKKRYYFKEHQVKLDNFFC